jgi:hypothetical protein
LCDVETLTWTPLATERSNSDLRLHLKANWALVILRRPAGPAFVSCDPLPRLRKGASTKVHLTALLQGQGSDQTRAVVTAPGLRVDPPEAAVFGEVTITVPPDALPGNYSVRVSGKGVLGVRQFLVVE